MGGGNDPGLLMGSRITSSKSICPDLMRSVLSHSIVPEALLIKLPVIRKKLKLCITASLKWPLIASCGGLDIASHPCSTAFLCVSMLESHLLPFLFADM